MNQRPTAICIPTPCSQPWAAMTPTRDGRHCAVCQTEVVDFTEKSSAEILAYLHQATGRAVCGRLQAQQLATALPPVGMSTRCRGWLNTLLTVGSLSILVPSKVAARVSAATELPDQVPKMFFQDSAESNDVQQESPVADSVLVRGVVLDAQTRKPLPYATLMVKGTRRGIFTNTDGNFELLIPPQDRKIELVVVCIGYETITTSVSGKDKTRKLKFLLHPSHMMLGRIAVPAKSYGSLFRRLRAWCWFG